MKLFFRLTKYFMVMILFFFISVIISFLIINYNLKYELPTITKMQLYDNQETLFLSSSNNKKQTYVNLDQVSNYFLDAIISIEDKRFYQHQGIDIIRIFGALINDLKAQEIVEGASTITQQYVRMLYLNNEQTINRKLHEILIAINLESKYGKDQILEGYVNILYMDHGIYGIEDASLFYFGVSSDQLTLMQACALASIPKGPTIYSPINNPENNRERRELILSELYQDQIIDHDTYYQALNEELELIGINPHNQNINAPYFQDLVMAEVLKMGIDPIHLYQGVKVYTTLDSNLNQIAIESINNRHPQSDIELSIVAIDPQTGYLLTLIGGKDYQVSTYNRAIYSKRQPGSTIKPFLYLAALENGFTLATTFRSEPTTFYLGSQSYSPTNYQNIYADQDISMIYAIATSDNIYAMKTHLFLGTNQLVEILKRFKFSGNIPNIASLALGTYEVSLMELTNGYSALANLGNYITPTCITKITTYDDKVLYQKKAIETESIASSSDVYLLNEAMTSIFDNNMTLNIRPTGARLASILSHTYSGKSGSTDTDNLMLGYNPNIVVGVWSGYDDNREIISSADTSFGKYIWRDLVEGYLKNIDTTWYQTPENIIGIDLNPITGFYPGVDEYYKKVYFKENNIPWYIELLYGNYQS